MIRRRGERMRREGLLHPGVVMRFERADHRIDFADLIGKHVMVYSQHNVVQDLIAARLGVGGKIMFEAEDVSVHNFLTDQPCIRYRHEGAARTIDCDMIAGCDGFHGVCRPAIPAGVLRVFEREYPFGWLGILAEAPPSTEENVYVNHERGFALLAMRSPTLSRLYLQCAPDEDLTAWSDDRIWAELQTRAGRDGFALTEGPILQRGITPMRSFVVEPMQCGRLYLAGDAAHIVPPTGAKGLNLAAADVAVMTRAIAAFYRHGDDRQAGCIFGDVPAADLEGATILLVDDDAAASLLRSLAVRAADAGGGAGLCVQFACRVLGAGGELRRTAAGELAAVRAALAHVAAEFSGQAGRRCAGAGLPTHWHAARQGRCATGSERCRGCRSGR